MNTESSGPEIRAAKFRKDTKVAKKGGWSEVWLGHRGSFMKELSLDKSFEEPYYWGFFWWWLGKRQRGNGRRWKCTRSRGTNARKACQGPWELVPTSLP